MVPGPADSMATGTKMWLLASCLYLASLLPAALSAAVPERGRRLTTNNNSATAPAELLLASLELNLHCQPIIQNYLKLCLNMQAAASQFH